MVRSQHHRKHRVLESTQIGLSLQGYDDLFSDFDPRSSAERALSEDFLTEIKRASKDKPYEEIELTFLLDKKKRSIKHEDIIQRRLHDHFRHHYHELTKERSSISRQGWLFTALGVIVMFLAATLLHEDATTSIFLSFLIIVLEPAGWFLFWEGLNLLIFVSKDKTQDYEFYETMNDSKITFKGTLWEVGSSKWVVGSRGREVDGGWWMIDGGM